MEFRIRSMKGSYMGPSRVLKVFSGFVSESQFLNGSEKGFGFL